MEKPKETDDNLLASLNGDSISRADDWEDFVSLWTVSQDMESRNQWFKGDLLIKLSVVYGEGSIQKFSEAVGESHQILEHYRRVSRAFPSKERSLKCHWTHYLVASFSDKYDKGERKFSSDHRFKWLKKAHDNNWTTGKLEAEIRKAKSIRENKGSVFEYYNEYLDKIERILLHVEIKKISDDELKKLREKVKSVTKSVLQYLVGGRR